MIPVQEALAAPDIVRICRAGMPLTLLAERWSDQLMRQVGRPGFSTRPAHRRDSA